ncbi:MAG: hypothetical protein ACFCVF_03865 [Kineosporiaceae bacterium]
MVRADVFLVVPNVAAVVTTVATVTVAAVLRTRAGALPSKIVD